MVGQTGVATTDKPTLFSNASIVSLLNTNAQSTPLTFQAQRTLPIAHHREFSLTHTTGSTVSTSRKNSALLSSRSTLPVNSLALPTQNWTDFLLSTPGSLAAIKPIRLLTSARTTLSTFSVFMTSNTEPRTHFGAPLLATPGLAALPHSYCNGLSLLPSLLRPHCMAAKCLIQWQPIFHLLLHLPLNADDQCCLDKVLAHTLVLTTHGTYGAGLLFFHVFCDECSMPEEQCSPASPDLISVFIASIVGAYSASAICNYVAGLRVWHLLHQLSWTITKVDVSFLYNSAKCIAS